MLCLPRGMAQDSQQVGRVCVLLLREWAVEGGLEWESGGWGGAVGSLGRAFSSSPEISGDTVGVRRLPGGESQALRVGAKGIGKARGRGEEGGQTINSERKSQGRREK